MISIEVKRTSEIEIAKGINGYYHAECTVSVANEESKLKRDQGWREVTTMIAKKSILPPEPPYFSKEDYEKMGIELTGLETINAEIDALFETVKEADKARTEAEAKIKRAESYDNNFFITVVKPALEIKGHTISVNYTKEEFVENSYRNIELRVDDIANVNFDYNNQILVNNGKYGDERREKKTRSMKPEKIVEAIKYVISATKSDQNNAIKFVNDKDDEKKRLETILRFPLKEVRETQGYYAGPKHTNYRTTEKIYFVASESNNPARYIETHTGYGETRIDGYNITNLGMLTAEKMKKIAEIINS